jgi:prolipoprotein diacylglyceryltransferase
VLLARKYHFSFRDFFLLWDLLVVPASFGISLWRIWNFLNQELYGRLVSDVFPAISSSFIHFFSSLDLFYVYERVDWLLRINTNFLASFFEWILLFIWSWFVLYLFFKKKSWTIGLLSSLFLSWYSLIRFLLEYLRMDSQGEFVWFFTKSQRFFLFFFFVWCLLFYRSIKSYIK